MVAVVRIALGQRVRFVGWKAPGAALQLRSGTIVAMNDTKITVQDDAMRATWTLPYAASEMPAGSRPSLQAASPKHRPGLPVTTSASATASVSRIATCRPGSAPSCASIRRPSASIATTSAGVCPSADSDTRRSRSPSRPPDGSGEVGRRSCCPIHLPFVVRVAAEARPIPPPRCTTARRQGRSAG